MDHGITRNEQDLLKVADKIAMEYLKRELEESVYTDDEGHVRQDWDRRRKAAVEIVRRAGMLEALRNMSGDGRLRPPPPWPRCDIVPEGGGTGKGKYQKTKFLDTLVRTLHPQRGVVSQRVRIVLGKSGKPTQDQLGDAFHRGARELKRLLG
jgi:hypothetical protein